MYGGKYADCAANLNIIYNMRNKQDGGISEIINNVVLVIYQII